MKDRSELRDRMKSKKTWCESMKGIQAGKEICWEWKLRNRAHLQQITEKIL